MHSDALKERDQEHAATLTRLGEAKSNQECCICYDELDGFSLSSNHGESSSLKKLHKRACFLPCMHANVCATCSERRWNEGPKVCPVCCQRLTEKPRVIYLWGWFLNVELGDCVQFSPLLWITGPSKLLVKSFLTKRDLSQGWTQRVSSVLIISGLLYKFIIISDLDTSIKHRL